jgi:phage N-6-adenine-methyltransferase
VKALKRSDYWRTPAEILDRAVALFGRIDLDPASDGAHVPALHHFTKTEDGLTRRWFGRVFHNPPFSQLAAWTAKARDEYECGNAAEVLLIVRLDPTTGWWQPLWRFALAIPRKRTHFIPPAGVAESSPNGGIAIFYMGPDWRRFAKVFGGEFAEIIPSRERRDIA